MDKKRTKKALLSSAISLLLCCVMLIGTTFAWFTDEVTSASNKIQSGTLKVDLEVLDETTPNKWVSVKGMTDPIFNYNLWEPGYTQVKVLKVQNEGTLALKWKAALVSTAELSELADVIDVYVKEDVTEYPESRDLAGWTNVGTLSAFINGIETTTTGTLEAGKEETLGIAFKMQESAGNNYQGLTLGEFDIKILAAQYTSEEDSFDDQYDADAKYPITPDVAIAGGDDADANNAALSNAISSMEDTNGDGSIVIKLGEGTYKFPSYSGAKDIAIVGTEETVIDLTLGAYLDKSTLSFEGVTIKGGLGYANGNGSDYAALYSPNVTYTNCTFEGGFRVGRDGAKFIGCTFDLSDANYVWTYGNDVEFVDCIFNTAGKALLVYKDGGNEVSKVTVSGCTFNATTGAKAGAIANQNCAAIEIDNYGCGVELSISGNTIDSDFSGEWRIKSYDANKAAVIVNSTEYTTLAVDGKTMTIDADKNVTVE